MKLPVVRFSPLALGFALAFAAPAAAQLPAPPRYPVTPRGVSSDDVAGVVVADPYRWLENSSATSGEVRGWLAAESALATPYLARLPHRAEAVDLVARQSATPIVGAPFGSGERLFFFENNGLENQPALYVQDRVNLVPRVLVDPNVFSRDGQYAIVNQAASPDGRYLAY